MRNIIFDESSVLTELARIMDKKGLLKVAAEPAAALPAPTTEKVSVPKTFDDQVMSFPLSKDLFAGKRITDATKLFQEWQSPEFKRFAEGWKASPDADGRKKFMVLKTKALPYLEQVNKQLAKMPKNYQDAYTPVVNNLIGFFSKAELEGEMFKEAAEKLYDVTGETGEDLVEKAHGKGVYTEVDAKGDGALVENLVEQQKADIAVVNKVPKGVYAALLDLADKLDKLGEVKAANEVDEVLKKLAALPMTAIVGADSVEQINKIADEQENLKYQIYNLNELAVGTLIDGMLKDPVVSSKYKSAFESLKNKNLSFNAVLKEINKIVSNDSYAKTIQTKLMGSQEIINLMNKMVEIKSQLPNNNNVSVEVGEPVIETKQKQKGFSQKVLNFQKAFNQAKGPTVRKIKEDGLMGPETRFAQEAVEGAGGMEAFRQKSKQVPAPRKIDKGVVLQELKNAMDQKFREPVFQTAPAILEWLGKVADSIVSQTTDTDMMKYLVNKAISKITKEDLTEAAR